MISAFFGLDNELNGQAAAIALSPQANPWNIDDPFRPNPNQLTPAQLDGLDGLPVVFSELLDPTTVDPSDFRITTASGAAYTPVGATVNPAHDAGERRTVALFGEFGDADGDPPVSVSLVEDLLTTGGVNISDTASPIDVIPLADGSTLAYVETVDPGTVNTVPGSELVVRAVWTGGIVAADGNEVTEQVWSQYVLSGTDASGNSVELAPIDISDLDDNDNNHLLYFDQAITPGTLFLPGGLVIDPNGDVNPATSIAFAAALPVIYATGQLFIPGDPSLPSTEPDHYDRFENYIYAIDIQTGIATAVSPAIVTDLPSGLAGTPSGDLLGFASGFAAGIPFGQPVQVDPDSASLTNIGPDIGLRSAAFDVTAAGSSYILPFDSEDNTQRVHAIDVATGSAMPIGSAGAIGDAIDVARGTPLGTAEPFVISLGSVGNMLYGVDGDTNSLVAIDSATGAVSVVGVIGAVGTTNGGGYSAFSALTGVDTDLDGEFDELFGAVNQFDDGNGISRLGGIARFNLTSGEWAIVGTNPGITFFGFGSAPSLASCRADVNGDGIASPADFNAWILAFNNQAPECDQNGDEACTPADFNAWILNLNAGCP
ncbi:MAG: GC-type dockerin domain-anchored protein [Planctomycetota bacterium]